MITINMLSSADKVKGQGVSSAYLEQVDLVKEGLKDEFDVKINSIERCDIMHYHTIDLDHYLGLPISKANGVTVGYVHFLPETMDESLELPSIAKKSFYQYIISFYKNMDYLVTVNPYFIKKLAQYNIDTNKIIYIPNFVSSENFYPYDNLKKIESRKKLGIDKNKFVVLGVGQVQTRKGINDFIEIAENFKDIQFIWAGGFSFGYITDGYKDLKKIMECPPENVKFLGIVDRESMNEIYNIADVMFLPSYSELFPMTVLEAMNCKLPILLRDLDIYPEILFNFYLKGNNNQEFKDIIEKLHLNSEFYNCWKQNSWNGHQFYSKENVLKMWSDFYNKIYYENKIKKIKVKMNKKYSRHFSKIKNPKLKTKMSKSLNPFITKYKQFAYDKIFKNL